MVAAAVVGGLATAGSAAYSANQAKKGAKAQVEAGDRASALEQQSADKQLALQREIWEKQQADYKPYLEQGTWGINRLGDLMRNQTPIGGVGGQYYQSPASNSQSTYISGGNDPFYDYQGQRNIAARPTNPQSTRQFAQKKSFISARPTNPQSTANAVAQNLKNFSGVDWFGTPGSAAPLFFGLGSTNIFGGGTSNTSQPQPQPQPQPQQQYRNNANGGQLNNPFDTYLASKGLAGGRFDTSNPAYQFQLKQGQQALDRSSAARGMGYSGAQMKAAQQFGQGLASQEYDKQYARASGEFGDYFNRLAALSQGGQQAAGSMAQAGGQYANNASNTFGNLANAQSSILGQQANARASGYAASANAFNQGLGNMIDIYGISKKYG
jgi:hypothetical protein